MIEQVTPEDGAAWHGQIQVKTQGPQAAQLLAMLQKKLERDALNWQLQMQTHHHPEPAATSPTVAEPQFVAEPAKTIRYGVSYGWTTASDQLVDDLCQVAEARGITILRDKTALGIGDRIAPFMQQLAAQDRVFVILSDKYLKSPNCMYELFEIWRIARQSDADFLARVRVYRLPDADIFSAKARLKIAAHWQTEFNELNELAKQHGANLLGAEDFKNYKRMQDFAHHIGDILFVVADTLQPKTFEELLQTGFA